MNIPADRAQELKDWLFSEDGPYGSGATATPCPGCAEPCGQCDQEALD